MNKYDMEERLINFSILTIEIAKTLMPSEAGNHLSRNIVRLGTSIVLNYREAQNSKSGHDYIYKMETALKAMRETFVSLKVADWAKLSGSGQQLQSALDENSELISILLKHITIAEERIHSRKYLAEKSRIHYPEIDIQEKQLAI